MTGSGCDSSHWKKSGGRCPSLHTIHVTKLAVDKIWRWKACRETQAPGRSHVTPAGSGARHPCRDLQAAISLCRGYAASLESFVLSDVVAAQLGPRRCFFNEQTGCSTSLAGLESDSRFRNRHGCRLCHGCLRPVSSTFIKTVARKFVCPEYQCPIWDSQQKIEGCCIEIHDLAFALGHAIPPLGKRRMRANLLLPQTMRTRYLSTIGQHDTTRTTRGT